MEIDLLLPRLKRRPLSDRKKAFAMQLQKAASENIADLAVSLALSTSDVEDCFNHSLQTPQFVPATPNDGSCIQWIPITSSARKVSILDDGDGDSDTESGFSFTAT
jgi:hypothetical protein